VSSKKRNRSNILAEDLAGSTFKNKKKTEKIRGRLY